MDRAIGIIAFEIEKRKSKLLNKENFLRINELKFEIESLEKALKLVKENEPCCPNPDCKSKNINHKES